MIDDDGADEDDISKENKGIVYERYINTLLQDAGLQPKRFKAAGHNSGADAVMLLKGVPYNIEIKLSMAADFGQSTLEFVFGKNDGKWVLRGSDNPSSIETRQMMNKLGVPKIAENVWARGMIPRKFLIPPEEFKKSDRNWDFAKFKEKYIPIPSNTVAKYYNSRDTYYIQIGGKGLYYLGKDIAGLGVPEFNPTVDIRIRMKTRSTKVYGYMPVPAIKVSSLPKSKINLEDEEWLAALAVRARKTKGEN